MSNYTLNREQLIDWLSKTYDHGRLDQQFYMECIKKQIIHKTGDISSDFKKYLTAHLDSLYDESITPRSKDDETN